MPEGPEVLFMIDSLQKFKNCYLNTIKITSGRYKRHNLPNNFKLFNKNLPSKINHIKCKGKFIYIILENEWCIWITLGMTGHFVFDKFKHTHYSFITSEGDFYIDDMRNFGTLKFNKINNNISSLKKKLNSLGIDPLKKKNISYKEFKNLIKTFNSNMLIAELLLNQSFFCGLGNYLRSEILYEAKINPKLKLNQLNNNQLKRLYKYIFKIPLDSYNHQKKYLMLHSYPFKIYKKTVTPKGEKVKKYKIDNRSVFTIY
jgi:formamidopyrimidine-DNA glycosylase